MTRHERLPGIDMLAEHADDAGPDRSGVALVLAIGAAVVLGVLAVAALATGTAPPDDTTAEPTPTVRDAVVVPGPTPDSRRIAAVVAQSVPPPLLAAELFVASPARDTAAALFDAIGGVEALQLGTATGAFDLVTFDPADPNHLLASHRSTYGPADNADRNEEWFVEDGRVRQVLYDPARDHDVVHFNDDGSVTIWEHSGVEAGYASRTATVTGGPTSSPLYASRSVVVDGVVFALTGSPDYHSPTRTYEDLVADRGGVRLSLDDGAAWARVDSPAPDIVVAYPTIAATGTRVWSAHTLEELVDHPLAGMPYAAVSISGDGGTAAAVTLAGELEAIDLVTGTTISRSPGLDPRMANVPRPITLDEEGRIAVTVGRLGTVALWWIGDDDPIVSLAGASGPSRDVPEFRAPRSASAIAPDTTRVALKVRASPGRPTRWRILDTDLESWVARACDAAGRPLTADERRALGLDAAPRACG